MTDVTTIKVQGQTVWFEALTDDQVDDALTHMPPTQQRILGLAGRGLGNKEICAQLGIKASTLASYKKQKLFHDCFYTMAQLHTAITTATVKKVAQADALDSYLNIRTLATVPPDATAAEKRVALRANETILRLAGSFESEAVLSPAVSIGQMLINLDREHGRAPEPWENTPAVLPQWKR
jgi:hypothetical protein